MLALSDHYLRQWCFNVFYPAFVYLFFSWKTSRKKITIRSSWKFYQSCIFKGRRSHGKILEVIRIWALILKKKFTVVGPCHSLQWWICFTGRLFHSDKNYFAGSAAVRGCVLHSPSALISLTILLLAGQRVTIIRLSPSITF